MTFKQGYRLRNADVDEQVADEKRLRLTQYALDHFSDSAVWLDQEGRIIYVNDTACRVLGYTREELLSLHVWDIDMTHRPDKYRAAWEHIKMSGRMYIESVARTREGRKFPVEIRASYLAFEGTELVMTFVQDITERKRAEQALKESEEKFRVLAELSPTAIFLYQGEKLVYANPAGIMLTGFSKEEILAKNFWDMIHPEYREMVKRYGLARQRGEQVPTSYDVKYITKGGKERWAELTAGYIEYRGRPAGIVTANDTTERKRSENALQEAKEQAELYVDLMGHDINNMNQAAMGFLELAYEKVQRDGSLDAEDADLLVSALGPLRSSSDLIDSVRKLQREKKGGLKPQIISLSDVLASVKERHSSVPGREVNITYTARCDCKVLANELLIDVFSNLVGNAIKHSEGALEINISLDRIRVPRENFCRVAIEDTGPGIPDERKRDIFGRVKKDEARMRGKGLGLYLVKTLVDDYRGRIWIEDRMKGDYRRGSRFVVVLPAADEPNGDATAEAHACGG